MNASSKSFSSAAGDAEITAELPVLDVAAYEARQGHDPLSSTDTWSSPTQNTALLPQLEPAPPADDAEPAVSPTQPGGLAAKLEVELRSLASNLAELETRLAAKGERLTLIEAELAHRRQAVLASAARAAALSEELTANRTAVAAATTQLIGLHDTLRERDEAVRQAA